MRLLFLQPFRFVLELGSLLLEQSLYMFLVPSECRYGGLVFADALLEFG